MWWWRELFGGCLTCVPRATVVLTASFAPSGLRSLSSDMVRCDNSFRMCSRQVTLVGESFGGCLALRVAAAAPELVSRMVLVSCLPPAPGPVAPARQHRLKASLPTQLKVEHRAA